MQQIQYMKQLWEFQNCEAKSGAFQVMEIASLHADVKRRILLPLLSMIMSQKQQYCFCSAFMFNGSIQVPTPFQISVHKILTLRILRATSWDLYGTCVGFTEVLDRRTLTLTVTCGCTNAHIETQTLTRHWWMGIVCYVKCINIHTFLHRVDSLNTIVLKFANFSVRWLNILSPWHHKYGWITQNTVKQNLPVWYPNHNNKTHY